MSQYLSGVDQSLLGQSGGFGNVFMSAGILPMIIGVVVIILFPLIIKMIKNNVNKKNDNFTYEDKMKDLKGKYFRDGEKDDDSMDWDDDAEEIKNINRIEVDDD